MESDDKGFEIIFTHRTPKPFDKLQKAFYAAWVQLNANQELMIKITFERRPIYQVMEKAE